MEPLLQAGEARRESYKSGKIVTKDVVETTTAPSQVELISNSTSLKADGSDVAVVKVIIKDAKGRVVPTADNLVQFSLEGPRKIIGTGNPSSHAPDRANQRMAFNGYCLVLIQADNEAGVIRLKAFSEKLKGNEVLISVK